MAADPTHCFFRMTEDGFEEIPFYATGSLVINAPPRPGIKSGISIEYEGRRWICIGRGRDNKIGFLAAGEGPRPVSEFLSIDLRTFLLCHHFSLWNQTVTHRSMSWRVALDIVGSHPDKLQLTGSGQSAEVNVATLIDENLVDLQSRCVVVEPRWPPVAPGLPPTSPEDMILVDDWSDYGYRVTESEFDEIACYPPGALVIRSGRQIRYQEFDWIVCGAQRDHKFWLCRARDQLSPRIDLRTLLTINPELLRDQTVTYAKQWWQARKIHGDKVELTGAGGSISADAANLIDANLADLKGRCVYLSDKG